MSTLTALAIAGPLWLGYVSHALLVIITESSLGDPEVRWPDESVMDWWWKPLYCVGMLSFWLTGGAAFLGWLVLVSPWAFGIVAGVFVWYAYPIGMLCVMDAQNSMAVVYLPLIVRLLRRPGTVLLVGLATLPLGVGVAGLLFLAFRHSTIWVVALAFVVPVTVLLYAHSWGRLAWMVLNAKRRRLAPRMSRRRPRRSTPRSTTPGRCRRARSCRSWTSRWTSRRPTPARTTNGPPIHGPIACQRPRRQTARRHRSRTRITTPTTASARSAKARAEGRTPDVKRLTPPRTLRSLSAGLLGVPRRSSHARLGLGIGILTLVTFTLVRIAILMLPG